ncbi:S-formylglutathione hydrolase [Cryptococcus amylolentus CBS 6039]|uniref:S-formylglutathione hydrolase n=2 Tax=Cryptococcus amylolentus TaxID=104669 RepID=A0A1E3HY43_9TREE|nr:S-formylglutathione hydrolase [Cryptococcus amylolentus CBS 6039]ODN81075.1 S-formylglutathione hydrolase [Cryptococcus amylolentus CBS 6039]ODO09535.1 S-formylglutathione hydrolase [Cryptococcus amylolentus CBS 6273]
MVQLEKVSSNKVAGGFVTKYKFPSTSLSLPTQFNLFVPSNTSSGPVPVLFYLAGLTRTEDAGAQLGGFSNKAGEEGIALVYPDTSPRGAQVEGEDDDWQLGTGAGFYINATNDKWKKHYNMYDLVVKELPEVLKEADLGLDFSRWSIMGHSMGGHGALSIYLKNPGLFKSASAFAPICNPSVVPWGINAFKNYINASTHSNPPSEWLEHDSTVLLERFEGQANILIDVGTDDHFLKAGQLTPESIEKLGKPGVEVRRQEGYDHTYFFVSTFAPDHIAFHAKALKA